MFKDLSNEYFDNAIDELNYSLGIKEEAPYLELEKLLSVGKIKNCVRAIASYLGLPVEIDLFIIPRNPGSKEPIRIETSGLSPTDSTGHGIEGVPAQVLIPDYLPLYGCSDFINFHITVKVSDDCRNNPKTFMAVLAHELSHVVLRSLKHPQKDNEIYTDLTAMVLGFASTIHAGRKSVQAWPSGEAIRLRPMAICLTNSPIMLSIR